MSDTFGWTGKILRVDLASGNMDELDSKSYGKDFIGGRGIAAKLMWEITSEDQSADPLIFMTGPLGGTIAPFGGRTVVAGYAPQGYPNEWYSTSTFGGYWGPELKYAGYDGIVITGESPDPVYIWIDNGEVEIREANSLWGLGHFDAQEKLKDSLGEQVRVVSIGQAGENLSRISIIETETESAAGQGGFGGLMGKKKLKAIPVRGDGKVEVANPSLLMDRSQAIREEIQKGNIIARDAKLDQDKVDKYGERWYACTEQCSMPCMARHYSNVPGPVSGEERAGQLHCCAPCFGGEDRLGEDSFYNWSLDFESSFDVASIANDLGINHWELQFGLIPWLKYCREEGAQTHLDGTEIDPNDPHFWAELMHKISSREGVGEVLAEGCYRAAKELGWCEEFAEGLYPAWGYAGHFDARGDRVNTIVFPFWLVPALLWSVDTRDPFNSSHGYVHAAMMWSPFGHRIGNPEAETDKNYLPWDQLQKHAEEIYGTSFALDPTSGYKGKAEPAVFHAGRSALKDSLFVCDWEFPCLFSFNQEDGRAKAGGMEGIDFEWHLFTATTGVDVSKEEFYRSGERICNLERALQVRDFDRTRSDDEVVIPHFEEKEWWKSPVLDERVGIDTKKFRELMGRFYRLRGWSVETGRPTKATLEELDLIEEAKLLDDRNLLE